MRRRVCSAFVTTALIVLLTSAPALGIVASTDTKRLKLVRRG
jgi:hypothetical protein